jgi:hypothetical protein
LLLPPSRLQPCSPLCVLPGPGPGSWVARASQAVLPVELRLPTRPPRFLPRYHREARRGDLQKTRAITTASELRTLDATNEFVFFRRRHEDGVRRDRVLLSIVFNIRAAAVWLALPVQAAPAPVFFWKACLPIENTLHGRRPSLVHRPRAGPTPPPAPTDPRRDERSRTFSSESPSASDTPLDDINLRFDLLIPAHPGIHARCRPLLAS